MTKPQDTQGAGITQPTPGGHTAGPEGIDDLCKAGVDYVYNPEEWETTWDVSDQCFIDDALQDAGPGTVMTVSTLIQGPNFYAVRMVSKRDDDGEPIDHEVRYFSIRNDAELAIARATGEA